MTWSKLFPNFEGLRKRDVFFGGGGGLFFLITVGEEIETRVSL